MSLLELKLSPYDINEFPVFSLPEFLEDNAQNTNYDYSNQYGTSLLEKGSEIPHPQAISRFYNNEVFEVLIKDIELEINLSESKSSLEIIEEFSSMIMRDSYSEAKDLIDSTLMKASPLGRSLSLSLLRMQLFESLKLLNREAANSVHSKIRSYEDFKLQNGYLESLMESPHIFQTNFFSNIKLSKIWPALLSLASHLVANEGFFGDCTCSSRNWNKHKELALQSLEHIEEEVLFYSMTLQKIFESIGSYEEIYLNYCRTYDNENPEIMQFINQEMNRVKKSRSEHLIPRIGSKRVIFTIQRIQPTKSNSTLNELTDCTLCSEETSFQSKHATAEIFEIEDVLKYKFPIKKESINKRILKHLRKYTKSTINSLSDTSSFLNNFSQNKFKTPVIIDNVKFSALNNSYMHWIFSNNQIAYLYTDFINSCIDFILDDISKVYRIESPKDLQHLKQYIQDAPALFASRSLEPKSMQNKKSRKAKGPKSAQKIICTEYIDICVSQLNVADMNANKSESYKHTSLGNEILNAKETL